MSQTFKTISILAAGATAMMGAFTAGAQGTLLFNTSTPIPLTTADWSSAFVFPKFNSSLGILNSVQLNLSSSTTTTLTVQNISNLFGPANASSGTASSQVQISVQDAGHNLGASAFVVPGSYGFNLVSGGMVNSGPLTQNGSNSSLYTQPPVLVEFTGGGYISLVVGTTSQSGLAYSGGNTFASLNSVEASLTGSVTYNYTPFTPAPEPTELALALLSGISVILLRRQSK